MRKWLNEFNMCIKKYRKLIIPSVFGLMLVVVLWIFGFRITYAPKLETSWDAVSACAAWAGVIASFVAIWFAIQIPKKIAEEQNKIALFEKRFECYLSLQKILACGQQIGEMNNTGSILACFNYWICAGENELANDFVRNILLHIGLVEQCTISGSFLFNKYDFDLLQDIFSAARELILKASNGVENLMKLSQSTIESRDKFARLSIDFFDKYMESIEEELNISSKLRNGEKKENS